MVMTVSATVMIAVTIVTVTTAMTMVVSGEDDDGGEW